MSPNTGSAWQTALMNLQDANNMQHILINSTAVLVYDIEKISRQAL